MTIAERIGALNKEQQTNQLALDFIRVVRRIAGEKFNCGFALERAKAEQALPHIQDCIKAISQVGGIGGAWGGELSQFQNMADGFLASLRNFGVFDRALPSMKQVPLRTNIAVLTTGATATTVPESAPKPISRLTLAQSQLEVLKSICILVSTQELLRQSGGLATRLFAQELANAVAVETDRQFLAEITSGAASISSSGSSATALIADLESLISMLTLSAQSKVFIAMGATTASYWFTALNNNSSFANFGLSGGTVGGIEFVVSDGVSAGQIVAFDAAQIAA